jgi:hypothetical protein
MSMAKPCVIDVLTMSNLIPTFRRCFCSTLKARGPRCSSDSRETNAFTKIVPNRRLTAGPSAS